MSQTTINFRLDSDLKKRFERLCDEFGLSTTTAITLFMKAVIRERRIPFEIKTDTEIDENAPTQIQNLSR